MQREPVARKKTRTVLVGVALILLALVIVLLSVFVPRWRHKKRMQEQLDAFLQGEVSYILLTDPRYDTGDLLGNRGKELRLDALQTEELLRQLRTLREAGLCNESEESLPAGSFDLRLLLRAQDGAVTQLYVRAHTVGYLDGTVLYSFEAGGDAAPIETLFGTLTAWLAAAP